ncbi:MAG: RNA-guided endonuclease IscB [Sediminibacterium sp.]|uniref:RNA-guided endonuclease IscB n=1 Tax=Sediminibacterium sp. TaxID=1917865 RepID=UPI002AB9ECAF|nr:RNA-guided endonuclease IscB [Sediminibacterium sp.]MDZ4071006.1 RNA-guided endonuclease IscB [Sediminibacterium sp.]
MQQLAKRTKTNTPTDAPQVRSNCGLPLNKVETLSVANLKTSANNLDVDLHPHTGGLIAVVYVLSVEGLPLMPCSKAKARKLLKAQKANVVTCFPFTIQLNFVCENKVQDVDMGIDSGYQNIGFSCVSTDKELASGTVRMDGKTSERLMERRIYRRGRRNKLWYRKPRFLNRKKKEDWLPPSIQRRYDTHLKIIRQLKRLLPISSVTIEVANFDIAKIENPEISGTDYQQGDMYGYQNMRSYLMARERGCCQLCHKQFSKGQPSHIHHCLERSKGGSNRPKNLAILHKKCHDRLHKMKLKLAAPKSYKPNTYMAIIQKKFWADIPDLKVSYGYITFINRIALDLEKTHFNDAFVIAGGTTQQRIKPLEIIQKHKNNRVLQLNRKGYAPSIRRQRYAIQPKDLVWLNGEKMVATGVHCNGRRVMIENKSIPVKKIDKTFHFGTFSNN